ncbi:hypothetical protein [Acinetobacter radioresistens]|uniref:hypothetical protein n=1 Tax=Acinetobacter radioresistens TaxID=40216 RepID=UPI002550214B|nr:hypothetical protein [Acinetobacter radioresistens]MDK8755405.1 hypothetical protein [Acinetobacter radioresistens]
MRFHFTALGIVLILCTGAVWAEPAVQAGDTLASLSTARITTTLRQTSLPSGTVQVPNETATSIVVEEIDTIMPDGQTSRIQEQSSAAQVTQQSIVQASTSATGQKELVSWNDIDAIQPE